MPKGLDGMFAAAIVLCVLVSAAFVLSLVGNNPRWYAMPIGMAVVCAYAFTAIVGKALRQQSW